MRRAAGGGPSPGTAALYEDRFATIDRHGVHIKWYYFPTTTSKFVPFGSIAKVEAPAGGAGAMRFAKQWGVGLARANVWFACDMTVPRRVENAIILHTGSYWRKGFSVEDRAEALRVIREGCERVSGLKPE